MRFARLQTSSGIRHAVAQDDLWAVIEDPFVDELIFTGDEVAFEDAKLLAPVEPKVLIGIAHNRNNNDHPLPIQAWHKSVRGIAGPGDAIQRPSDVRIVNIEGELAVVIGKPAYRLTLENAFDAVFGYTIANDVTNPDQNAVDEKSFQSKGGINYTPLGPWIETEVVDPESVGIEVFVNGKLEIQSGSFNLPSSVAATLVYVTSWVPLGPGDVILTGSPKTWAPVQSGDVVDIALAGLGTLTNPVE